MHASVKLAAYGILADDVGSGAGTFPKLLRAMLERGHHVHFYGMRGFNHPRSLERFQNYRFVQVRVPRLEWLTAKSVELPSPYPAAGMTQIAHLGYQRETVRHIEAERAENGYDLVFCTDAQALRRSELPVMCWPQSPPQTEASALRVPDVARAAIRSQGIVRYASTQVFYGYRWVLARAALGATDLFVCGSSWARDEWRRFGADAAALRTLAYPIDLDAFADIPPVGKQSDRVTFLWLGRAVPRKRLDLFLAGFELLVRRRPEARARLVGNLLNDPFAARLLEPYLNHPAISIEGAVQHARVKQLFAEVDVIVQPSQHENFGFSVAEALAAGRAVVLGPTNGTRDYTGEAGFEFADYRPEPVADAMERALAAVRENGPALSALARAAAQEHFDLERITPAFAALCSEAVARGRARARHRSPRATSSAR